MKCKKCGTEVDDRAKFCPVCGEPLVFGDAPQAPQPPRPNYAAGNSGNSGGYRAPITSRSIPLAIILLYCHLRYLWDLLAVLPGQ